MTHLPLIWWTMCQPKIVGCVGLFCMKPWFFIAIIKKIYIAFINLIWIIQISVEGGLPLIVMEVIWKIPGLRAERRPSRVPESRWVMESFRNRITHRKFQSRGRLEQHKTSVSQPAMLVCLHHKRVIGRSKRRPLDKKKIFWRQRRRHVASLNSAFAQALVGSQICVSY